MAGSSPDIIEAAAKILKRDGKSARNFTVDDLRGIETLMKRKGKGFIERVDPDWNPEESKTKKESDSAKPEPEPVKPQQTDSRKSAEELEDVRSKEMLDHYLSSLPGEDKKGRKKSSKKVSSRERLVREVKAMQQQKAVKEEGSDKAKDAGKATEGSNEGKGSSGEEDGTKKSMSSDTPKLKMGEQRQGVKVEVHLGKDASAKGSKVSERSNGKEEKAVPSRSETGKKKMTATAKSGAMRRREIVLSKGEGGKKKEVAAYKTERKVPPKPTKSKDQLKLELTERIKRGQREGYTSEDLKILGENLDDISCPPEFNSYIIGRTSTFRSLLSTSERMMESVGVPSSGPPVISYEVSLHCMSRGSKEIRELHMWKVPKTFFDIKERIEREFQIPRAFQGDLTFLGKTIDETTPITRTVLRAGSRMEMTYLCEGEIEEVYVVLKWFEFMLKFGNGRHLSIFKGLPVEYNMIAMQGINECIPRRMAFELLVPADDKTKYANRVYFLQQNGLHLLLDVYEKVLWTPWRTLWFTFKFVEIDCIAVLAALGYGAETRKTIVKADGHGFVMQSLLRVAVSRFDSLVDTSGSPGNPAHNDCILKELLTTAISFFFNFRDNPDVHMDICPKSIAVDQMIAMAHCSSFSVENAQDCMCVLACCMHSPDVHKYLCRNPTLEGIADCVNTHRVRGECSDSQLTLLHYYAQVTLAHLVISSGSYMSLKVVKKVLSLMEDFLKDTESSTVYSLEFERHHAASWTVFFPYVKAVLSPKSTVDVRSNKVDQVLHARLQNCSLETMLFVMQVMCNGDPNIARRNLLDEKLLAYVFCLSSNVPRYLQYRARELSALLRRDSAKPVPFPKLNVIARAKLAVMHVGLKKAMDRSAKDLKLELMPSSATKPKDTLIYYVSI